MSVIDKERSQIQDVLNHLLKYGKITSLEAINKFGAIRLSGIIFELRKRVMTLKLSLKQSKIDITAVQTLQSII